ncbi:peptide deformylase [Clostridium sp. P21]|uniref:Peptide deformylase n=1 Tax=Clostridium muellerianum TaxID=2716538 RepID=A0A7Y0ELI3_9CLOT|nr:peptide deformylase [Clostridium muellerianum]NMM65632.1 peptide deformylase [Clostridium muellerianum]
MALRNIRKYGDELLRKKSKKIENINERILTLLDDMAETMYDADGVGLAAPQVGILKRVVVIDVGQGILKLINPEIISTEGSYIDEEGCLSVPGQQGKVERPYKVKVKALNEKGEEIIVEGEELLARALCHEIDHLEGILFVDKIINTEGEN